MSGVTKKIFEHELIDIYKMWNYQLKTIEKMLPQYYTEQDVITLLRHFYPHEWNSVQFKYEYYSTKDKQLKRIKGITRYNMVIPEILVKRCQVFKKITSLKYLTEYSKEYSQTVVNDSFQMLDQKRKPKIDRINNKIENAKQKTQQVTPEFLDQLIGLYERKNTSQKDRMYIFLELKKYYNPKIIQFFFKLNDTELNRQLRESAFYHLQSFNYQPRLRRQKYMQIHTKNRKRREYLKKIYPYQTFNIPLDPDELDYRINNSLDQKIKHFDLFISHSSKDSKQVQVLINYLNTIGKNVYCDWISDSDYLKRNLVRQATLNVIEKRLQQSKAVLFVDSPYSTKSVWCKYELNYFSELNRPIYQINISDIENNNYEITAMVDKWFGDVDYKNSKLFE
ncbi:MAG: toll/interleukin-1 receptor domain-containing protein [Clostridium sp.]|nr:toll/interleukin-1 receptor domain-containing protein [Clostridium sp.]